MRTDNEYQLALPYAEGSEPNDYSDAEFYSLIPKMTIADKDLDCYSLGVLMRLHLLWYFNYNWEKIYEYGSKAYIEKALNNLERTGYIKQENGAIKLL